MGLSLIIKRKFISNDEVDNFCQLTTRDDYAECPCREKREIRNDLVKQRYNERKEKGMFIKDKHSQKPLTR